MNTDGEHFFLISNKGSNGLFVPELKQVDFFVLVKEFSRYTSADDLQKAIGKIEIVSSIIELDPTKLKSADNFLMVEYSEK
jgi:hypothetical protein